MYDLEYYRDRVLEETGVTLKDFLSTSRKIEYVEARHAFFLVARTNTKHSLSKIGAFANNRDHSTVIHGIQKMKDFMFIMPKKYAWLYKILEDATPDKKTPEETTKQAIRLCDLAKAALKSRDTVSAYKMLRSAMEVVASSCLTDEMIEYAKQ